MLVKTIRNNKIFFIIIGRLLAVSLDLKSFIDAYKKRGTELLFAFRGSGITVHNKQSKAHAERERLYLTLVVLEIYQISKDKCKVNAFYMFVPALFVR